MNKTFRDYLKKKTCSEMKQIVSDEYFIDVKPYREDLPTYIKHYCHIYTNIVSNMDNRFKQIPVFLFCNDYPEVVAHFILYDKETEEYIDAGMNENNLQHCLYYYNEKLFEKIMEASSHPDVRLRHLKQFMGSIIRLKSNSIILKAIFKIYIRNNYNKICKIF